LKKIYRKYFWEFILVLAGISYSFEWYFVRTAKENDFSSLEVVFWRLLFSMIFISLFIFTLKKKQLKLKRLMKKDLFLLFILWLFTILGNWLFNSAVSFTNIANTLVIMYLSIFWTVLFGWIFLKEKFTLRKIIYFFLAFFWITLAFLKNIWDFSFQFGKGEFLALILSFLIGTAVIISKKLHHIHGLVRSFIAFIIGFSFLFCFLLFQNWFLYFQKFFTPDFIIPTGLLGLTAWAMGRGLKEIGTNYVPASIVLVIMLSEPISQMTTAYFLAGEKISFLNFIGIILVFSMIILISKKKS